LDHKFKEHLSAILNEQILGISSVSGGDINQAARLETSSCNYFIKWNDGPQALHMFQCEVQSLDDLAKTCCVNIPDVIICSSYEEKAYLLLEFVTSNNHPNNAELYQFGIDLANLHRVTKQYFGNKHDNYIGILNQVNSQIDTWDEFYITNRLQPQLEQAKRQTHLASLSQSSIDKFYKEVQALLIDLPSSLLHGDLWSGNYMISDKGSAYLVDPASYYGHREVDIAMSELFGGFGARFYDGYNHTYKISADYKNRKDIYQLYYLLVHLNIFGKQYEESCKDILCKFE